MSHETDEPTLPFESLSEGTFEPKKKTARRGRPPKKAAVAEEPRMGPVDGEPSVEKPVKKAAKRAPKKQAQPEHDKGASVSSAPKDHFEDDEVRVVGVNMDDFDDEAEGTPAARAQSESKSSEGDSATDDSQEKSENEGQHDRHDRNDRNHKRKHKKDFQRNHPNGQNNKFGKNNKFNKQGKHQDRNPRNNRNQKQPRKFLRDVIGLADGSETDASGLELGELPNWDVLRDLEDMEGLVGEFASVDEALDFNHLYGLHLSELREAGEQAGLSFSHVPSRPQLLRALMEHTIESQSLILMDGLLEVLEDGNALLVYPEDNYRVKEFSAFVPQAFVKLYGLQRGHQVKVLAHPPRDSETAPYALEVLEVNGMKPEEVSLLTPFTELVPYYPTERIMMEREDAPKTDKTSMRVVDLLTPIGLGQRGLIVAPPRTGKTVLMQGIANSIAQNKPTAKLIVLLIDERPEEVTDFRRNCAGEVIASTFDEPAESHVHAAEMVIERARRMVEAGEDVVILLDSITRLARAYNTLMPSSGKILSGGVEANAMQKPKRFFGSARNIEEGGSLTILGTALVETGSRMDEVVFEEFKGTGNMELHLDRELSNKRIFPSLSFERCGTRKEELLYHPEEMAKVYGLRRAMKGVPSTEAMEMLITRIKKTKSNAEFLMTMSR